MGTLGHGRRFVRGFRRTMRHRLDRPGVIAIVEDQWRRRDERFLEMLDRLVWPFPESPHRQLLAHAGVEPGDVAAMVERDGVDPTVTTLAGSGVYVSYEEYRGKVEARRGSAVFSFTPSSFANPVVPPDLFVSSGGTRSPGVEVGSNFADRPRHLAMGNFERILWDIDDAPTAVWAPVLPGAAALSAVMGLAIYGNPAERWFSQVPPLGKQVVLKKRVANVGLPVLALGTGSRIPVARYVPTSDPEPVLAWCLDALAREGRALLHGYASSLAAVATLAVERGTRLDGLVMRMGNEPMTPARRAIAEAAGARPFTSYGFTGGGNGANACPQCPGDEMHVRGHSLALTTRRKARPDGVEVDALLWTNLASSPGQVWLNVENDDYARLTVDDEACPCAMGQMGVRQRLSGVRGISKVVAGGINVPGEVFEHLVDRVLPARFGGGPGDYQFSERERDGAPLVVLRVAPRLGSVDGAAVQEAVVAELQATELGRLALDVWSPTDSLQVERTAPHAARSGKLMAFEPLPPATDG
jgi:hypothetical protein